MRSAVREAVQGAVAVISWDGTAGVIHGHPPGAWGAWVPPCPRDLLCGGGHPSRGPPGRGAGRGWRRLPLRLAAPAPAARLGAWGVALLH